MRSFGICVGFGALLVAACGGAPDSGLLGGDGGATDGTPGDGATDGASGDSATNCDVTRCAAIPAGFHPLRLSDGKAPCPGDWTSTPVVASPVAADGTCTCDCNVTKAPTCGDITRYGDVTTTPSCTAQLTTFPSQTTCTAINGSLYLQYYHYQVTALPAQGGACEFDAHTDTSKVTSTSMLLCQPPDKCVGEICGGDVCVAQDGDVACPAGFPTKTLVGASASATCGTCGGTCAPKTTCGGTLGFYTDAQCTQGEVDFPTDATCDANNDINAGPFTYYELKPTTSTPTCGGTPTLPTATTSLDTPSTVCCK